MFMLASTVISQRKILIIEKDEWVVDGMRIEVARSGGASLQPVKSVSEGLNVIDSGTNIDLVVLDASQIEDDFDVTFEAFRSRDVEVAFYLIDDPWFDSDEDSENGLDDGTRPQYAMS